VFGAQSSPRETLTVRTADGGDHDGVLLGWDKELGLAVARMEAPRIAPLSVAKSPGLIHRRWVVVLRHDTRGRAEPFAGEVEADAAIDAKNKRKLAIAPVMAPASRGSPVLSAEGELVGVALEEGARSTRVVAIETFVPFLKAVVLGRKD
jgi:S1-C subfamily serine protease